MKKKIFPLPKKDSAFKEQLFDLFFRAQISKIKVPILKLINNHINSNNKDNLDLFIKNNIYDKQKAKSFINNEKNMNLAKYLYKILFMKNNPILFDNQDFIELIFEINKYQNNINKDIYRLKKMIIAKIIIELINSYEMKNSYNINDIKINTIKDDNITFLNNNINYLKEYKLDLNENDMKTINIEELYLKIIIQLIKNNNFKKDEIIWYNVSNQLELDSIYYPRETIIKIIEVLNTNEKYIYKNLIKTIKDLFNPYKINFYFFLFKYILKNSIYIYYCPFLLTSRKNILKIINSELNQMLSFDVDSNLMIKIEYIIRIITDTEYYYTKFLNYLKLKEVLIYYKNFYYESKKDIIRNILNNINNKNESKYFSIFLNDYSIAKRLNERKSIIEYLCISKEKNTLNKCIEQWEKLEKIINDKQFKKVKRSIKLKIAKYLNDKNIKEVFKTIFKKDIYKYIKQKCNEFLIEHKNNNKIILDNINYKQKNIIKENEKKIKENNNSLNNDLSYSKNEKEKEIKKDDTNIIIESNYIYNTNSSFNRASFSNENNNNSSIFFPKFKFVKLIGKHYNSAEFIKIINNNFLISGGSDKKLLIYNNHFYKIKEIRKHNFFYNICIYPLSFYKIKDANIKYIIACLKDEINVYEIQDNLDIIFDIKIIKTYGHYFTCLNLEYSDYLFLTNKGVKKSRYVLDKMINNRIEEELIKMTYKGGIIINENELVLTSNKVLENGKDELSFYDKKDFNKKIEGFSFIITSNGLTLISGEENNNEILICACKKYISNQKNGILSINIQSKNYQFYDTNNYEVYCFCPIIIKENLYILTDEKNKRYKTNYFLVGGFDKDKQRGVIKLYKIKKKDNDYELLNICNIGMDDSIELLSPISCITQFNGSDSFLISSLDGNICWFNLDCKFFIIHEIDENIEIQI